MHFKIKNDRQWVLYIMSHVSDDHFYSNDREQNNKSKNILNLALPPVKCKAETNLRQLLKK